jgi:uncharacterized membrane protein YeaQ/YmgE (transglycosylase-associated protein family)
MLLLLLFPQAISWHCCRAELLSFDGMVHNRRELPPLIRSASEQFCTSCAVAEVYSERAEVPLSAGEGVKMNISGESLFVILAVGIAAGWLAGQIVMGTGLGLVGDLVVGIAGAFIASWMFPQLGIHLGSGIVSKIIDAAVGAVLLLVIIGLFRGRSRWGGSWGGAWRKRW